VLTTICGEQLAQLPYFRFISLDLLGVPAVVSRTGYTGELGYEIFLPAAKVAELWQLLLADPRVKPAGLGARDLLRLEVGYSLYGSDLDQQTTPLEAGLEGFVNFDKSFVGKEALLQQQAAGPARRKIAFTVNSRRAPRHGYQIQADGRTIGEVTSGVFSPMLGCGIGIGYVQADHAALGTTLTVCQERVSLEATVCSLPFYSGGSLRN
jgi:aminomethyltransferase